MKTISIMKIFIPVIVVMLAISTSIGGHVSARAQAGNVDLATLATATKNVSLSDLGYTKDQTFQGVVVNQTYAFRWPNSWTPKPGNAITIQFSHPKNLAVYSSMAVDFNDVRIGSVLFTADNADHGSLKLDIPANIIKSGYNALTLYFYMGIDANYCLDLDNPGVWATIHSASSFDFSYDTATPAPDLGLFPYPLVQKSELLLNKISIVTPASPSPAELKAVAMISAKLGQLNSFYNMDLVVVPETAVSSPASLTGNVIYVGLSQNLKVLSAGTYPFVQSAGGTTSFVAQDGKALNQDDGVLWEDVSPGDPAAVRLIVTGNTDAGLEKAASGLANDSVYVRLKGQLGVVEQIAQALPPAPANTSFTLEQLGYIDQTASGTIRQNINYSLHLTSEWRVATEATFNLHFAHSALLYPQGSVLTLLINDIPVGSDLLTADNAQDGKLSYKIPARLFKIGSNTLTVQTTSQLRYDPQDQYFCNKNHFTDAWITIYSDSTLKLPDGPTSLVVDLKNYPDGFTNASDLSDLGFVVPDSADQATAQSIAWIAARLGRSSDSPNFSPNIIKASDYKLDSPIINQIFIEQPSKNPAIYQVNSILPLPFAQGKDTLENPERIAQILSPTGTGSIGYIQAGMTKNNQPRLVVTGNSSEGVLWAAKALNDQASVDLLKGDLAILDGPGSIYSATIQNPLVAEVQALPTATVMPPLAEVTGTSTTWVLWLSGALFLLTLLIIIIFTVITIRNKNK